MIKTVMTCPLGSECEKIIEGEVHRCAWYVEMAGMNPQTGEQIHSESKCAMSWIPILLVEGNGKSNQVGAAVESLRETVRDTAPLKLINDIMGIEHAS